MEQADTTSDSLTDWSWAKETDTIFWDMDLVLYEPCPKFIRTCWKSSYKTAMHFLPHLNVRQAITLSQKSWTDYHSGYDALFNEHKIDQQQVFFKWHDYLDESFIRPATNTFKEKMQQSAGTHMLITHGSRSWSTRVLKQRQLADFFPEKNIISIEDNFPHKKSTSPIPYQMAIDRSGCDPQVTPMVEDSQVNLLHAKNLGLKTIAVHQRPGAPREIFTDYMLQSPELCLDNIIAAKNNLNPQGLNLL